MKKKLIIVCLLLVTILAWLLKNSILNIFRVSRPNSTEKQSADTSTPSISNSEFEIVYQNLENPWEIVFLPNGDILVSLRSGKLIKFNNQTYQEITVDGVAEIGEGGLLGIEIHPEFEENHLIYLYSTYQSETGIQNKVESYQFENNLLTNKKVIIDNIKGSAIHNGGRIKFGPDGLLYITTGDAGDESLAQDTTKLNGKILRLKDDGSIPADNPFNNPVYSYGHRNPQGLAWDRSGHLWSTEHGPSGLQTGYDEVNLIKSGGNYGWPYVFGDKNETEKISPIIQSGANDTWAPSGMTYFNGALYFAGLRGQAIYKAVIDNNQVVSVASFLKNKFGRLRTITLSPDNYFFLLTSNMDGRGKPGTDDDQIIKFNPITLD